MVHWDEVGLTSVVKLSDVVEPVCWQKESKAKVKWDQSIFLASILEIDSKKDVKKEKDFHLEKAHESTKDVDEGKSTKRRQTSEGKKSITLQLRYKFAATSLEVCSHFARSSQQLRSKFAATSLEVRKVRTSHGNIFSMPTIC